MRTVLVVRHDTAIGLGNLGPVLERRGYRIEFADAPTGAVAGVDPLAHDLVLVLGGDESAYALDAYPYLADEVALLQARVAAEAPVLGVCLGAQLLAQAMGGRAYRGPAKEVGWLEVRPTAAGAHSPVRHVAGVPVVQWHGDTFDLPEGVTRLAGSPQYPNQAFGRGDWLLAVQFHPEVTEEIHEDWLALWGDELPGYGLSVTQLRAERAEYGERMQRASAALLEDYLDRIEARARPSAA
ncbi:GMP synthase [Agromyces rhizosphaerae]|uniref:GMP synthase n=1 Tax=Agromyces rhizosphaerae TaxID=88374 RepID=A0A9W6CVM0_9MICO|nr:gamma-glutamyl-gamma-aminobutyrate hydrolase family protein [Agromyces rhizosphaerae]GLI26886.1 GMP synthase [Agromyces rhizosphaerae]